MEVFVVNQTDVTAVVQGTWVVAVKHVCYQSFLSLYSYDIPETTQYVKNRTLLFL